MRFVLALLVFVAWVGCICPLSCGQEQANDVVNDEALAFDVNQTEPILVFNRSGGMQMRVPATFKPTPEVRIYADGTIKTGANRPQLKTAEGKLERAELLELLDFVVNQNGLSQADSEAIKKAIAATGRPFAIADVYTF